MASGLSAHLFAAVISIGSSSSQKMHLNSVRPDELVIGTILFPQCKQRVTRSSMVTSLGSTSQQELWFQGCVANCMQDVVEQVMRAYGLMVNLTPKEEQAARDRLEQFLKDKSDDTRKLAVEGVKFLRGNRISRARRA